MKSGASHRPSRSTRACVLVVHSAAERRRRLRAVLSREFRVSTSTTVRGARLLLRRRAFDVLLIEVALVPPLGVWPGRAKTEIPLPAGVPDAVVLERIHLEVQSLRKERIDARRPALVSYSRAS